MGHGVDELNNEKIDKWKRNEGDKIDNTTVKKDCNCHQLKVFKEKISMEWKRQKKNK